MNKKVLAIVLVTVLVGGGYLFYQSKKKNKIDDSPKMNELRIGYTQDSLTSAAISIAYEKGYFEQQHILAKMVPLKSGKEVAQAMAAGQVDIGMGGVANFAPAMAKGAPIRFIAAASVSPSYIFIRPQTGLKNFKDLYGKTISVQSNGINDLIFRTAMSQENIDTGKMKFAEFERAFNAPALMEKKVVDAAVVADQDTDTFFNAGAVILPEWETAGYSKQAVPRNAVAVDVNFLNKNESVVHDFLVAYINAQRFIKNDPMAAAVIMAQHINQGSGGAVDHAPEKITEQWVDKKTVNMIWQDPAITMTLVKKAKEIGSIDKDLEVGDVYDLRFEKELQSAQSELYGQENK